MKRYLVIITCILLFPGCAAKKGSTSPGSDKGSLSSNRKYGDTRTKEVVYNGSSAYLLAEKTDDKTYGYDKTNPVKVGGVREMEGPMNERRYLNGLMGPNGEELRYSRSGSCCEFKTPHGMLDNKGLLDAYEVSWAGCKDTLTIYINMYDKGDLSIPVGLTARKL